MSAEGTQQGTGPDPRELLLEAAITAYREREPATGRVQPSPAWLDLDPEGQRELFERQLDSRRMERAVDEGGLSSTAQAVLHRLPFVGQIDRA